LIFAVVTAFFLIDFEATLFLGAVAAAQLTPPSAKKSANVATTFEYESFRVKRLGVPTCFLQALISVARSNAEAHAVSWFGFNRPLRRQAKPERPMN
jgi:hypothetical protein